MLPLVVQGWRSWLHAKSVAVLAILALSLGIGSATAIYTVVQSVLLNPLPYANPERYLTVIGTWRGLPDAKSAWSYPNCLDFANRAHTLESLGCASNRDYNLVLGDQAIHAESEQVSPSFVRSLGVPLQSGSWFSVSPNDLHTAVISDSLWKKIGSPPNPAGKRLLINSIPYTIAGVAPAWFRFPINNPAVDLWMPLDPIRNEGTNRDFKFMECFAKKKPGVTDAQANADMQRIAAELEGEHPDSEQNHTATVRPLLADTVKEVRPSLLFLLTAAVALLLIACGNVAGLLLARSVGRSKETAMRVALGATPWQLLVQYLAEGLFVSVAAAVIGIALSVGLTKIVLLLAADSLPRASGVAVDWHSVFFAVLLALVCGVLLSLAPLWQAARTAPNSVLTSGVRSSASATTRRLLSGFVIGEIALSFTLLAVAALCLQHLGILFHVDPGFDPSHVTNFQTFPPLAKYQDSPSLTAYQSRLLAAVANIPQIESAGFTNLLPLSGNQVDIFAIPDGRSIAGLNFTQLVKLYDYQFRCVSPGYLEAMRIPLRAGSYLPDVAPNAKVLPAVVSETVAHKLWPHQNPLGHSLKMGDTELPIRVVGVVGDIQDSLAGRSHGHIYVSYKAIWLRIFNMGWAVRTRSADPQLAANIRRAIRSVDPGQATFAVQPMTELIQTSVNREKLQSSVVSFFGAAALLLSILGIYGVMSYLVRQRIPEMSTRLALGATGNHLIRLVVTTAGKMALAGILIGLVIIFAVSGLLTYLHISVYHAPPFLAAGSFIGLATLLSSAFPALVSARLSPALVAGNPAESIWYRTRQSYTRFSQVISTLVSTPETNHAAETTILAEIAESTRDADSFHTAMTAALTSVITTLGASAATLLVSRSSGQPFRCLTAVPDASTTLSLPADSFLLTRLAHYYPALPITAGDLDVLDRWSQEQARMHIDEVGTLFKIGPSVAVPVTVASDIVGVLFVTPSAHSSNFTFSEMRLLRSVAAQLALMLENSRLTDRIVEQDRLRRELAVAAEVQQRLFPEHPPDIKSGHLAGYCLPARGVGGDYYDFLRLDSNQIGIALADVAGKGIAAALVMSVVQASLRSLAESEGVSPARLAARMNCLLCASTGPSSYATFFYATFDETTRRLTYVNGGHNPPFLLRNSKAHTIEELSIGGIIIGMFPPALFEQASVDLEPGDVLLAFTDGVSEAHDPNEEEFGEERLQDLLRKHAHLSVDEMSGRITTDLQTWMAEAPQHDDLTFILLKIS